AAAGGRGVIVFHCPCCAETYALPDDTVGQTIRCPSTGARVQVTATGTFGAAEWDSWEQPGPLLFALRRWWPGERKHRLVALAIGRAVPALAQHEALGRVLGGFERWDEGEVVPNMAYLLREAEQALRPLGEQESVLRLLGAALLEALRQPSG